MNKQKIILYDIETSPNTAYTWGVYEQNVIKIVKYGEILSFAYKELGSKQIKAYSLADFKGNEEKLVKKLWEVFNDCDIIVGHNGDNFDNKWSNRMFVKYNLSPPEPYKTIDTLKEAKKRFKFASNKLDDLGEYLGVGRKVQHEGFPLWEKCMSGDKKAFKKMVKYNKGDVALLEKVYLKLRPYMITHPVVVTNTKYVCPTCGSTHIQKRGWAYTNMFMKRRVQCQTCSRWFLGEQIRYKDKDKVLK